MNIVGAVALVLLAVVAVLPPLVYSPTILGAARRWPWAFVLAAVLIAAAVLLVIWPPSAARAADTLTVEPPVTIDWTIGVTEILTLVGFIGGGIAIYFGMKRDLTVFGGRLQSVEATVTRLADLVTVTAKQDARLDAHETRLARLEAQVDAR